MFLFFTSSEELGYLVDAIINTGDIASFDSDKGAGNLSQEDKILLSRLWQKHDLRKSNERGISIDY